MITIKVKYKNKARHKKEFIKTFNELTVKEAKQWYDLQRAGKEATLIDFLSITKNVPYNAAYNLNIKNPDIIINALGEIINYEKAKPPKQIVIKGKIYNKSDLSIFSVGQRTTITQNISNYEYEEMLCFILAVAMLKHKSVDIDKTKKLTAELLECNYIDVLPLAFFLLKNLKSGRNYGAMLLNRLTDLINIKQKKSRPEYAT